MYRVEGEQVRLSRSGIEDFDQTVRTIRSNLLSRQGQIYDLTDSTQRDRLVKVERRFRTMVEQLVKMV